MESTKISVYTHAWENKARGKAILQRILKKGDVKVFSTFNCFSIGNSGGRLRTRR